MTYRLSAQAAAAERRYAGAGNTAPERRSASIENPTVPVSSEAFLNFFGVGAAGLPRVTIDNALTVPAVLAAVAFLSRTMAALPLHVYGKDGGKKQREEGSLKQVISDFWNDEQDGFKARQYFWQQVFTGGRGLIWIERKGSEVLGLWPMDPAKTTIKRVGLKTVYAMGKKTYSADEIIDVPFMLKSNGLQHYGPIRLASKAIQLALAMNDYGSRFFAGGGVPPLAMTGPLPSGPDAMKRALNDIHASMDAAQASEKPFFAMPPGYELKQVGFDPAKGQMTDARRLQIEEIARVYQLPPVFLQDLTRATFSNAEQQDLHLVKHLVGQWAAALEGEMNLKLFGRRDRAHFVEHNLDGLLRGDFKTRAEAVCKLVTSAIYPPNKAAEYMGQDPSDDPAADKLYMQGAMVPLGTAPAQAALPAPVADNGDAQ